MRVAPGEHERMIRVPLTAWHSGDWLLRTRNLKRTTACDYLRNVASPIFCDSNLKSHGLSILQAKQYVSR